MFQDKFQIIPAIDILDGKCVRLTQGKFELVEEQNTSPLDFLKKWIDLGANRVHIIDLDGAKEGKLVNFDLITHLTKLAVSNNVTIQVGGGIRAKDSVRKYLDVGVRYVILGTKIFKDFEFFKGIKQLYGDKVIVGLDLKEGKVALSGWMEEVNINLPELAKHLTSEDQVIYTNVSRDGTLSSPDFSAISKIAGLLSSKLIISGGISCTEDIISILNLKKEKHLNIVGVILGKSLYKGRIDLSHAIGEVQKILKQGERT